MEFRRRGSNRETQSIKNKINNTTKLQSTLCNTESNAIKGFFLWSRDGLPALAAAGVAADVLGRDAGPGTVTHLTAHQGMTAERLRLTPHTLRLQSTWGTDALARHRLTQACAAVTG